MQSKSCDISTKSLTGNTLDLRRYCKSRVDCELPASLTARPWAERGSCFTRDLLTARPWAERGSCFTRDLLLLTARPWAERGSCFTRDLLLTARPWAERGSCFTRDLLLLFFFMSVTRRKPPLGQIVIGTESRNL